MGGLERHLLVTGGRRASPGLLHLEAGLGPGRADQEVIRRSDVCRFYMKSRMLERDPGLDVTELHADLVPGLTQIPMRARR